MASREEFLRYKFKGIDANTFFDNYNGRLNDDLIYAYRAGWNEAMEVASLSFESKPIEEEESPWISVEEEEPGDGQCVLVAWVPNEGMIKNGMKHFYGLAEYLMTPTSDGEEVGLYDLLSGSAWGENIKVIAWMPLPEEYVE